MAVRPDGTLCAAASDTRGHDAAPAGDAREITNAGLDPRIATHLLVGVGVLGSHDLFHRRFDVAMSCSIVPPLTPTPAITWPSLVSGTPPPIAEYLPPETARRG